MTRRGEKKFDTFHFTVEGETIDVPVWRVDASDRLRFDSGTGMRIYFRAEYEPFHIQLQNTDINILRTEIEKEVRSRYSIKWDLFVMVSIDDASGVYDSGEGISFSWSWYAVGTRPDGKVVHMKVPEPTKCMFCKEDHEHHEGVDHKKGTWDGRWVPTYKFSGREPKEGLPDTGRTKERSYSSKEKTSSLIPATVENVETLLKFEKAIASLREEMMRRFAPDQVEKTMTRLKDLTTIPMLPGDGGE